MLYKVNTGTIEVGMQDSARITGLISSHTILKFPIHEFDRVKIKARIVLRDNRDKLKDDIYKDSAAADTVLFRLITMFETMSVLLGRHRRHKTRIHAERQGESRNLRQTTTRVDM